jgi:hypothetical protein
LSNARSVEFALLTALVLISGCRGPDEPRLRFGTFFGSPIGMHLADVEKLGEHSCGFTLNETNAIVYTRTAGFIDIDHVRGNADKTRTKVMTGR